MKNKGVTYVIMFDDGQDEHELTFGSVKERDVAYATLTARRMTGEPIKVTGYLELQHAN